MLHLLHLGPRRREGQRVPLGVAQDEHAVRGEKLRQLVVVEEALRERGRAAADVFFTEGRVGQDQIELRAGGGKLRERGEDILDPEMEAVLRQARGGEVLFDEARVLRRRG